MTPHMCPRPVSRLLLLAVVLFQWPASAAAQDAAPAPAPPQAVTAFEVASVKPSDPNPDPNNPLAQIVLMLPQPGGRFTATNTPLGMLIAVAFELPKRDFEMKMDIQMVLALAKRMGANIPSAAANIPQADGSSLTTALNEQLGLKLESTKDGVTVVVIDSVEAPVAD